MANPTMKYPEKTDMQNRPKDARRLEEKKGLPDSDSGDDDDSSKTLGNQNKASSMMDDEIDLDGDDDSTSKH